MMPILTMRMALEARLQQARQSAKSKCFFNGVRATRIDHRESHGGIAAAASHPMNSDSEQTSRDDGSANKYSQKQSNSEPPSNASERQRKSLSVAAVTGGAQQDINEEDLIANTSRGHESPINVDDSNDSSEEARPYQAGNWEKNLRTSVSIVKARDIVFSTVKTQSLVSFRSGCFPNTASTFVWSEVNLLF
jgi:hypothetical protein